MKLYTEHVYPPIPDRSMDWLAYDADTYGGEPGEIVGRGPTEREAIEDLFDRSVNRAYDDGWDDAMKQGMSGAKP